MTELASAPPDQRQTSQVEPANAKPQKARSPVVNTQHPKFKPTYHPPTDTSPFSTESEQWVTPLSAPAYFTLPVFHQVLHELSLHPEQNSSLIIRAEPLPAQPKDEDDGGLGERLGLERTGMQRLRFIPRQPQRDARMEQRVFSYSSPASDALERGLVLKVPDVESTAKMPYYHPPVRQLAFLYEGNGAEEEGEHEGETGSSPNEPKVYGTISVSYLPFPDTPTPAPGEQNFLAATAKKADRRRRSPLAGAVIGNGEEEGDAKGVAQQTRPAAVVLEPEMTEKERIEAKEVAEKRLQRTCLALLERLSKHGYGTATGYVKRVVHDVVVKRAPFQDLYQALKERHKQLDSRVPQPWSTKVEDVKRHVWKYQGSPDDRLLPSNLAVWGEQDIAIAAFLMLLWKDMYPPRDGPSITGMEWDQWGRPAGGFVDLGCGNALLVHILISDGYDGKGYELRARRTWPQYPTKTQDALVELPIDLPTWFPETLDQWDAGEWPGREDCAIRENSFIIGNHADEITPWIPLLSLIPRTPVPFVSLPCCLHTLDGAFTTLNFVAPNHPHKPEGGFEAGLESGQSRYKAYIMWLGYCGLLAGWKWEKEGLRIPSTRGWAIVARNRWSTNPHDLHTSREWALGEVTRVRQSGVFKVREKEGKDH